MNNGDLDGIHRMLSGQIRRYLKKEPLDQKVVEILLFTALPNVISELSRVRDHMGAIRASTTDLTSRIEANKALGPPTPSDHGERDCRKGICTFCGGDYQHCCLEAAETHFRWRDALEDMAEHGGRFDTSPTFAGTDVATLISNFTRYLQSIDWQVRDRAQTALAMVPGNSDPAVSFASKVGVNRTVVCRMEVPSSRPGLFDPVTLIVGSTTTADELKVAALVRAKVFEAHEAFGVFEDNGTAVNGSEEIGKRTLFRIKRCAA